jgi:hypothetical protein
MQGYDFGVLWQAGRAVWLGQDPYQVTGFFYPLPVAYFFALLALLPRQVAFWVWLAINLVLLGWTLRRRMVAWTLYFPLLHQFSSGQVDLVLWVLGSRLSTGWQSALAAAVITLKPQVAFIMLPWTLGRWLREDRRTLMMWVGMVAIVWGCLLPLDPTWTLRWRAAVPPLGALSRGNTPGLWSLERLLPGVWPVLLVLSVGVFLWGLFQERKVSWAAAALANPSGLFYTLVVLMEAAPPWLLVPLSWVAVGLTIWWQMYLPWLIIPLGVLVYHYFRCHLHSEEKER